MPKLGLRILLVVVALEIMLHPSRPRGVVDVSHLAGYVYALVVIDPLDLRFHRLQPIQQKGVARCRYQNFHVEKASLIRTVWFPPGWH